jgi:hypothetical protein
VLVARPEAYFRRAGSGPLPSDDYVAHTTNPRLIKGTIVQLDELVPRIHLGIMFPKEGESIDVQSEPPGDLLPLLDRYVGAGLDYLEPVLRGEWTKSPPK